MLDACVPAAAEGLPENPQTWSKVRRLANELSGALADCEGGAWMATIHPAKDDDRAAVLFGRVEGTAEERLQYHAKAYAMAASDIEPDARELWMGRAVGDEPHNRFYLTVCRQFATKANKEA